MKPSKCIHPSIKTRCCYRNTILAIMHQNSHGNCFAPNASASTNSFSTFNTRTRSHASSILPTSWKAISSKINTTFSQTSNYAIDSCSTHQMRQRHSHQLENDTNTDDDFLMNSGEYGPRGYTIDQEDSMYSDVDMELNMTGRAKKYEAMDSIMNQRPKKSLMHYRLVYLSGSEPLHHINYRKKVLNRILEACVVQKDLVFGKKFFEKYFILDRSVQDEDQFQADDALKEAFFNEKYNLLGWTHWVCDECQHENRSHEFRCSSCQIIRPELLLGKDYIVDQKVKRGVKMSRSQIAEETTEGEYFPDLPPVKANYETFHLYANLCARCGDSESLLQLLDLMSEHGWNPSMGIYVALLRLYVERGDHAAFFDSYDQFFNNSGVAPDLHALRLLSRVLRAEKNVDEFELLLDQMVAAYHTAHIRQEESPVPTSRYDLKGIFKGVDIVILNDMMAMYVDLGNTEKVLDLLDRYVMKVHQTETGGVQVEPTANTFNNALLATAAISDGTNFDRIWKEMKEWRLRKEKIEPNVLTYNAMLLLYKGIGATTYVKEMVLPHFCTSPSDEKPGRVAPNEQTWKLLSDIFYADVRELSNLMVWMRRFQLYANIRYNILFTAALKHLKSKYASTDIIDHFLVDVFKQYNRAGRPLHQETLVAMCEILDIVSERQITDPGLTKYWTHVLFGACTHTFEGEEEPQESTLQALISLGQLQGDVGIWRDRLRAGELNFTSFCEQVLEGYLEEFERRHFENSSAARSKSQ